MPEENIKVYVIDASYILCYLMPDEQHIEVSEHFKKHNNRTIDFISTPLLAFEVANSLRYSVQSNRLSSEIAQKLFSAFNDLSIDIQPVNLYKAFDLALTNNLSVYDSSYLSLSQTNHLPLLTLDKKLQNLPK